METTYTLTEDIVTKSNFPIRKGTEIIVATAKTIWDISKKAFADANDTRFSAETTIKIGDDYILIFGSATRVNFWINDFQDENSFEIYCRGYDVLRAQKCLYKILKTREII